MDIPFTITSFYSCHHFISQWPLVEQNRITWPVNQAWAKSESAYAICMHLICVTTDTLNWWKRDQTSFSCLHQYPPHQYLFQLHCVKYVFNTLHKSLDAAKNLNTPLLFPDVECPWAGIGGKMVPQRLLFAKPPLFITWYIKRQPPRDKSSGQCLPKIISVII